MSHCCIGDCPRTDVLPAIKNVFPGKLLYVCPDHQDIGLQLVFAFGQKVKEQLISYYQIRIPEEIAS